MISAKTRRRAIHLAEEIATRNGLSSHRDIMNLTGRARENAVRARKEFVQIAAATFPHMTSTDLADLLGCHHTTVLHHQGRTKRSRLGGYGAVH